jgi:hypothetical protein
MMTATTDVISTGDGWYESYDGGKTWSTPTDFTPAFVSTLFLCPVGGSMWLMCIAQGETFLGVLLKDKTLQDGSPRVEELDGVTVRHVVADVTGAVEGRPPSSGLFAWANGVRTLDLWVSTGVTPTIRQMKIGGVIEVGSGQADSPQSPTPTTVPGAGTKVLQNTYTLTWKLSRFNEQFEAIQAPPTAVTPQPTPPAQPTAAPTPPPIPSAGTAVPTTTPADVGMPRTGGGETLAIALVALLLVGAALTVGIAFRNRETG